jgi:hypothetical protein
MDDAVPTTAGAADKLDAGVASGIIQTHWDRVLERCVDVVAAVRHAALKVLLKALDTKRGSAAQVTSRLCHVLPAFRCACHDIVMFVACYTRRPPFLSDCRSNF